MANLYHLAPASLRAVGHDTQTYTNGKPELRHTATIYTDMSMFDKLVSGIAARQLSPKPAPGGQLPQGARLPGRPR